MKNFRFGFVFLSLCLSGLSFAQAGGSSELGEEPPITVSRQEEAPPVENPPVVTTTPPVVLEGPKVAGPTEAEVQFAKELAELKSRLEVERREFSSSTAQRRALSATRRFQRRVRSLAPQFTSSQARALRRLVALEPEKALALVDDLEVSVKNLKSSLANLEPRIVSLEDKVSLHEDELKRHSVVIDYLLDAENLYIKDGELYKKSEAASQGFTWWNPLNLSGIDFWTIAIGATFMGLTVLVGAFLLAKKIFKF